MFNSPALHPHVLSAVKAVVITPVLGLTLQQIDLLWGGLTLAVVWFVAFCALDALDGVVARVRGLQSNFGRIFDRVCDLPLVWLITWFAYDQLPPALIVAKLALDALLLLLFALQGSTSENRIGTSLSDATLLAMLLLSQHAGAPFVSAEVVKALLVVSIAVSAFIGLVNAGALRKHFIADGLSLMNAVCGVCSIGLALLGEPAWCLLLLLVGAGFDGLDGAAARRWGGTRFGVIADDIADGISYALAPAVAVAVVVEGRTKVVVGASYALGTIGRLVFFTLHKGSSDHDPRFFRGVPSTIGGIVVLCAAILFAHEPALVGFCWGVAVVSMVGFDSAYRHLGRVLFGLKGHREISFSVALQGRVATRDGVAPRLATPAWMGAQPLEKSEPIAILQCALRREKQLIAASAALVSLAASAVLGPRAAAAIVLGVSSVYCLMSQVERFPYVT